MASDRPETTPMPLQPTLGHRGPTAVLCRMNGWGPGTRLVGDEGAGPEVIELTAVGRECVLAVSVARNGKPVRNYSEGTWSLSCRDWRVCQ